MLDGGRIPTVEVSVEKIFTSELRQRIADLAIDAGLTVLAPQPCASATSSSGCTGCHR